MKQSIVLPGLALVLVFCPVARAQTADGDSLPTLRILLDPARAATAFEGIGAVSAGASSRLLIDYPEPYRSQVLDFLFLPKYGAGFQHLKVEIGSDINSTDGTEPSHMRNKGQEDFTRGYEWWLMKEARKRNPNIILDGLARGAPGWIGNYWSQECADYVVSYIQGAKRVHGLEINLLGIWNERDYEKEWIKLLRKTLDSNGLQRVKIVAADLNGDPKRLWRIAEDMTTDPDLAKAVHPIGVHYPWGEVPQSALRLQKAGKRLWSSEDGEWEWNTMIPYFHLRAQKCNVNWVDRHLTKTEFWSAVTSYYDCLPAPRSGVIKANTPWSGAYEINPTLWAVAHTTQFVEPGWLYLDSACVHLPKGGTVVALTSPDRRDLSLVVETTGATEDQKLVITVPRGTPVALLHAWWTRDLEEFMRGDDLRPVNGVWTVTLPRNAILSLTTTTGQRKGEASSPRGAVFPYPYGDDYETYAVGSTAQFLSDHGGALEVVKRNEGGQCLRQQIHRHGIDWNSTDYAYSLIGDMNWNDCEVLSDVAFEMAQDNKAAQADRRVAVVARCFPGATWASFGMPYPAGYSLWLHEDGSWKVTTANKVLAGGTVAAPGAGWHQLRISCTGNSITAAIDGDVVARITDGTYRRGLAGIGSGFHAALFDNLIVR